MVSEFIEDLKYDTLLEIVLEDLLNTNKVKTADIGEIFGNSISLGKNFMIGDNFSLIFESDIEVRVVGNKELIDTISLFLIKNIGKFEYNIELKNYYNNVVYDIIDKNCYKKYITKFFDILSEISIYPDEPLYRENDYTDLELGKIVFFMNEVNKYRNHIEKKNDEKFILNYYKLSFSPSEFANLCIEDKRLTYMDISIESVLPIMSIYQYNEDLVPIKVSKYIVDFDRFLDFIERPTAFNINVSYKNLVPPSRVKCPITGLLRGSTEQIHVLKDILQLKEWRDFK